MITGTPTTCGAGGQAELRRAAPAAAPAGEPHLLVVVDGAPRRPGPVGRRSPGVTVLRVGAPPGRRPGPTVVRLRVGAGRGCAAAGAEDGGRSGVDRPDARSAGSRGRGAGPAAGALPAGRRRGRPRRRPRAPAGCPTLLGLWRRARRRSRALRRRRWPGGRADRLRVPIGVGRARRAGRCWTSRSPRRAAAGRTGCASAPPARARASCCARWCSGWPPRTRSATLNLVLVDFKGGATFLGLAGLPHVSAVITNLADELTLVDRMADALAGEITRRQELLRAAGNLAGRRRVRRGPPRRGRRCPRCRRCSWSSTSSPSCSPSAPSWSTCSSRSAGWAARCGLHLLLASQRLDEGRLRGLESHLSYRIALRTFSAAESRAVLGVPDAHQLPPTPGSAFLATGTDELVRFRAAYVSGAGRRRRPPAPVRPRRRRRAVPVRAPAPVPLPPPVAATRRRTRRGGVRRRRPHRARHACSPRWPATGRPRTGCGCRRWASRRRWTRCSAPVDREPGRGLARPAVGGDAAGAGRPGRPALPAAPRPAAGRPGRARRAPRASSAARGRASRRRWPALCSALALTPHPGRAGRARARLRRRRARARWPGCRTSARSPTASSPTWCGAPSPRWSAALARRERLFRDAGVGVGGGVPGRGGRPGSSPTSRPPTCCSSSTATCTLRTRVRRRGGPAAAAGRAGPVLRAAPGRVGHAGGASCGPR